MRFQDYIGLDRSTPSRSGLYVVNLPGVSVSLVDGLTGDERADYLEMWSDVYERACENLVEDVTVGLQDKFLVAQKLATRETSQFRNEANVATGLAGVTLQFALPKYAKVHILSIEIMAGTPYTTPPFAFNIYENDEAGSILYQGVQAVGEGRTVINIDQEFEADKIFIGYNADSFDLNQTDNKYFKTHGYVYDKLACTFPCGCGSSYYGYVRQENGGGLNVKFVIMCSVQKFVADNLPLFRNALWYYAGLELVNERLFNEKLSQYTTMTKEEMDRLEAKFTTYVDKKIKKVVDGMKIPEDDVCFICEGGGRVVTLLP